MFEWIWTDRRWNLPGLWRGCNDESCRLPGCWHWSLRSTTRTTCSPDRKFTYHPHWSISSQQGSCVVWLPLRCPSHSCCAAKWFVDALAQSFPMEQTFNMLPSRLQIARTVCVIQECSLPKNVGADVPDRPVCKTGQSARQASLQDYCTAAKWGCLSRNWRGVVPGPKPRLASFEKLV
jgi:hypothetical protein